MLIYDGSKAYENLQTAIKKRTFRFPAKTEKDYRDGLLLPSLEPRFTLTSDQKIFTIGSCFARNIEAELTGRGFDVPVAKFVLPKDEFRHPGPHMLNEYNAGTILQRIESVFGEFRYSDEMGVEAVEGGYLDLFLHIHQQPVSLERLLERRREIAATYQELASSSALVITLGLVESWFDSLHGCYVNKAPSKSLIQKNPGRFHFHRMDVEDVLARMNACIEIINANMKTNIVLTVSPVPIEATFSGDNVILANSYSKSVLRVAASLLYEKFDNIDYFPSYEVALSKGTAGFAGDNIHIDKMLVKEIIAYMVQNYVTGRGTDENAPPPVSHYVDREIKNALSR
ncbi:MAG: GSCFA domain-containing protein [Rhodospirillaceae bacterium]|nr:GSCFA domain-containing protein [Rhodospirillaceae bacterium]